jgi:hypothetical protein
MVCKRFQSEGMKLLDGEMNAEEKSAYEAHLRDCEDCRREMEEIGMVVQMTDELLLRDPEDEFWDSYWNGLYRRMERGAGFFFVIAGVVALILYGIVRAVTSPKFLTVGGLSTAAVLIGFLILFLSVARERYYERKNDPYRRVRK